MSIIYALRGHVKQGWLCGTDDKFTQYNNPGYGGDYAAPAAGPVLLHHPRQQQRVPFDTIMIGLRV